MNYYAVAKIGTGTSGDPYKADIPDSTTYVCVETNENNFLVGTNTALLNQSPITDLQSACSYYGLNYTDLLKWSVG